MKNIQKNLVIIDYQYDFVAIDGDLTCGESAINIESNILELVDKYKENNIFVTYDTHYESDWTGNKKSNEARIFPIHCIYGTKGHELYGKLGEVLEHVEHEKIYKTSFGTEKLIKSIIMKNDPNEPVSIQFCGVATNVCVFQSIILCYNYLVQNNVDFEIIVDKNTVASFDDKLEKEALNYLENTLNVKIK